MLLILILETQHYRVKKQILTERGLQDSACKFTIQRMQKWKEDINYDFQVSGTNNWVHEGTFTAGKKNWRRKKERCGKYEFSIPVETVRW